MPAGRAGRCFPCSSISFKTPGELCSSAPLIFHPRARTPPATAAVRWEAERRGVVNLEEARSVSQFALNCAGFVYLVLSSTKRQRAKPDGAVNPRIF